jgi:hypothetical protein
MCEFCSHFTSKVAPRCKGRFVQEIFPYQNQIVPYNQIQQGKCMFSGRPISYAEMHPEGRCSRSLSEESYQGAINNKRSTCALCKTGLPPHQQQSIKDYHREIEFHFCPQCLDYFSLCHSKIVGMDMSFLADEQRQVAYDPVPSGQPVMYGDDVIDAEYTEVQPRALPQPVHQIGYQPGQTVDQMFGTRSVPGAKVPVFVKD